MSWLDSIVAWFSPKTSTIRPGFSPLPTQSALFTPTAYQASPVTSISSSYQHFVTPAAGKKFDPVFAKASIQYGIPYGVLSAIANKETGGTYKVNMTSRKGARGLMQLMPVHFGSVNPLDPVASIYYAAKMLNTDYKRFGKWSTAIAAYNAGGGTVSKAITAARSRGVNYVNLLPLETRDYIAKVAGPTGLINA